MTYWILNMVLRDASASKNTFISKYSLTDICGISLAADSIERETLRKRKMKNRTGNIVRRCLIQAMFDNSWEIKGKQGLSVLGTLISVHRSFPLITVEKEEPFFHECSEPSTHVGPIPVGYNWLNRFMAVFLWFSRHIYWTEDKNLSVNTTCIFTCL